MRLEREIFYCLFTINYDATLETCNGNVACEKLDFVGHTRNTCNSRCLPYTEQIGSPISITDKLRPIFLLPNLAVTNPHAKSRA